MLPSRQVLLLNLLYNISQIAIPWCARPVGCGELSHAGSFVALRARPTFLTESLMCRDTMDASFLEKPKRWNAKFLGLYMWGPSLVAWLQSTALHGL